MLRKRSGKLGRGYDLFKHCYRSAGFEHIVKQLAPIGRQNTKSALRLVLLLRGGMLISVKIFAMAGINIVVEAESSVTIDQLKAKIEDFFGEHSESCIAEIVLKKRVWFLHYLHLRDWFAIYSHCHGARGDVVNLKSFVRASMISSFETDFVEANGVLLIFIQLHLDLTFHQVCLDQICK